MSRPGETDYGKGSFPRTWNSDKFRDNFDEINWSRPEWPDFIGAGLEPEVCTDPECPWHGDQFKGDEPDTPGCDLKPPLKKCTDCECPYPGRHETKISPGHCALKRIADVNGSPKHEQRNQ